MAQDAGAVAVPPEPTGPTAAAADEHELRARIPVFVNSFEQLTYLRDTVDWFARHGFRNVTVVEQGSTYAPLLDYFASADFAARARLVRMRRNIGPRRAVRRSAVMAGLGNPFIFTDPDLLLPEPPSPAFLNRLFSLGQEHGVAKVGLALNVHDLDRVDVKRPYAGSTVGRYFGRLFRNPVADSVWRARVDTTFFLHVPQSEMPNFGILQAQQRVPALRVGGPGFLADHRPWLFENGMPPEEEAHYRSRTTVASTTFGRESPMAAPRPKAAS